MRDYLIFAVVALVVGWAVDAAEFSGRYSHVAWQQTVDEGRSISEGIQSAVGRALSGKCGLCG
jgi:hypothetical protein